MTTKLDNITKIPDAFVPGISFQKADIGLLVDSYIKELVISPAPNKKTYSPLNIVDFFTLIKNVIKTRQDNEGVPVDKRLLFTGEDPKEDLNTEAITWGLSSRMPGSFSKGPAGNGGVREVRGHIRSVSDNPSVPGQKIIEIGRISDNFITLYTWARGNEVALRRALWVEELFDSFNWYFKLFGFKVIEQKLYNKEIVSVGNLKLTRYPLSYFVGTDDTYCISSQELRELSIKTTVSRT